MPIIVENLIFEYSPRTPFAKLALDKINLRVEDGDFLGIIGHTGSGKSTFVQHLNALIKRQSGYIQVDDIELIKKFDYKKLRAKVGMVFQYPEYQLFEETVEKDVAFGPRNLGLNEQEIANRVRESIEMVGLSFEEFKNRIPFELSGGQKRRVAIAGILAMKPQILVLDEPTAGLDPVGKREILDLISRIKQSCSPSIIMISHNMDEIASKCNKVAVFNEGKIVKVLPPRELFSDARALIEMGLDVPAPTKTALLFRERGVDIRSDIIFEDELVDELTRIFGGAK